MFLQIYVALSSVVIAVLTMKELGMPEKFFQKKQDPVCAREFEKLRQEIKGLEKLCGEQTDQIEKFREELKNRYKAIDGEMSEMEDRLVMRLEMDEEEAPAPSPDGKKKDVKAGVGGVEVFTSRKAQFAASQADPTVWQNRLRKDKPAPAEPTAVEQQG
jgi:hypothetical protein